MFSRIVSKSPLWMFTRSSRSLCLDLKDFTYSNDYVKAAIEKNPNIDWDKLSRNIIGLPMLPTLPMNKGNKQARVQSNVVRFVGPRNVDNFIVNVVMQYDGKILLNFVKYLMSQDKPIPFVTYELMFKGWSDKAIIQNMTEEDRLNVREICDQVLKMPNLPHVISDGIQSTLVNIGKMPLNEAIEQFHSQNNCKKGPTLTETKATTNLCLDAIEQNQPKEALKIMNTSQFQGT